MVHGEEPLSRLGSHVHRDRPECPFRLLGPGKEDGPHCPSSHVPGRSV